MIASRPAASGAGAILGLALLLVLAASVSLALGAAQIPAREVLGALLDRAHPDHLLLFEVRTPRIALAALVGASLALAGALVQTSVRNSLADPGLLGVTSGAGLGALVWLVFAPTHALGLSAAAMLGGLAAIVPVLALSAGASGPGGAARLILVGVAANALFGSAIALITFFFADRAPAYVAFTVGSLNARGWPDVSIVAPILVFAGVGVALLRHPLDALLLDDTSARSLGVPVRALRLGACALAAALTGAAVSVAGLVGFVGLVVPNVVRMRVGPEHARLLPLCALGGALLAVVADTIARSAAAPLELPVGALLACVGGPYFLWLVLRGHA
ncbi:MAG: iron ABC transporter permease [Myxococcota bacterium]